MTTHTPLSNPSTLACVSPAACVRALESTWAGPRQLVLVGNLDQPSIEIANGDIVGAVLHEEPLGEAAHVWQDWGVLLDIPGHLMGVFVIAVGAQIPDTVQAIAVARRGFGSMAVASAVGSQVMNVLIGLGMPWTLSTSAGVHPRRGSNPGLAQLRR